MKRPFILGAGGFLGQHLASALAKAGQRPVLAGLRAPLTLEGESDQILTGHLSSFDVLDGYVGEGNTYYYLIGSMTPSNSLGQPSDFIAENLELFVRFLEWVEQKPGARVVYASSGGTVYGNADVVPTPETAALKPISYYGLLKSSSEQYLQLFAAQGRLQGTITRISNPFGPGQKHNRGQGLIPALVSRIRAGTPIDVINEGRSVRDYIFIDDVVEALRLAGEHEALRNEVVNVGSGRGTSVNQVIELVENVLQTKARRQAHPSRFGEVETSILDCSKLNLATGWRPRTDLMTGLGACI